MPEVIPENARAFNEWYDFTVIERGRKKKTMKEENRSCMSLQFGCHSPAPLACRYGKNKSTLKVFLLHLIITVTLRMLTDSMIKIIEDWVY